MLLWIRTADNDRVEKTIQRVMDDIKDTAKKQGLWNKFLYLNSAGQWQDVISSYGKKNVNLKEVSKKYDPDGLFQKAVPGGYKLPRAGRDGH